MLADEAIQLLTGYVDGELSSRQRKSVLRLLHESSEARDLLLQLQDNAHKIKQLPHRKLDPGFAVETVQLIAQRNGKPERPYRPAAMRLRWLPYAVAAAAAVVLFVATLGGALYVAFHADAAPDNGFAKGDGDEPPPVQPNVGKVKPIVEPGPVPAPRKVANPLIAKVTEGVYSQYAAVIPPDRQHSVSFNDLKSDGHAADKFVSEIKKNGALQLDVTVRSNPLAVDRLKSVLAKIGVKLVVDPASGALLKKGAGKTAFLVYAENVSHAELTKILKELATDEQKAAATFDKVAVAALSTQDHQLVASLFGIDPTTRSPGDLNIQGPKVPNKKGQRVAVVLPQSPEKRASEEVRQFLYQTARPLPGSVRVLVRISQE
jgi:hypothetical protein